MGYPNKVNEGFRIIKVEDDVYNRLSNHIERYGETMSNIIKRILDHYEKSKK
jgi:hypothetical protein